MKILPHLDIYDSRRDDFEDMLCCECSYHTTTGECANPMPVLGYMHEEQQDVIVPVLTFMPDGERNGSKCPGMMPGEAYLRATGQTLERPLRPTAADVLLSHGEEIIEVLAAMAPAQKREAA